MKTRIIFLKKNLNQDAIEYFRYLRDDKNLLLNETCIAMANKFPALQIGNCGFSLFLDGIALMVAITELDLKNDRGNENNYMY